MIEIKSERKRENGKRKNEEKERGCSRVRG